MKALQGGAFNKEKVQIGAFSRHCKISRSLVNSSMYELYVSLSSGRCCREYLFAFINSNSHTEHSFPYSMEKNEKKCGLNGSDEWCSNTII